jgi:predicted ATPase
MARFLHRVRLENYKSIAHCDVELKDLTFLVGPNGAGKSNFIVALRSFTIYKSLAEQSPSTKALVIRKGALFCIIEAQSQKNETVTIKIEKGKDISYKGLFSGFKNNYPIILYISLIPDHYKEPIMSNTENRILNYDGSNIANILHTLKEKDTKSFSQIQKFIIAIVPEIKNISILQAGGYDILQFDCAGSETPFNASQMSDGTLHALGILTSIFHAKSIGIPLIGIEEPEAGLHPAAARILREALIEASRDVQIVVTSHSPDLLDSPDIDPDSVLAVVRENGETKIGQIDVASREILNEHLFTVGELLRLNQLEIIA